ncbi:MAG: hypothetical protein SGARI_000144 [Bacillariaceae sp.]
MTEESAAMIIKNEVKTVSKPPKNKVSWMKKVAYAFRSPSLIHDRDMKHASEQISSQEAKGEQSTTDNNNNNSNNNKTKGGHHRMPSGSTMEYAHALVRYPSQPSEVADLHHTTYETSPLLIDSKPQPKYSSNNVGVQQKSTEEFHPLKGGTKTKETTKAGTTTSKNHLDGSLNDEMSPLLRESVTSTLHTQQHYIFSSRRTAAQVAASFLMDYEASRPPTLPSDFENITKQQLQVYRVHFSWPWRWFVNLAIVVLFLSHTQDLFVTAIMHTCVIIVFTIEMQMKECIYGCNPKTDTRHTERRLNRLMAAFLFFLGLESWMWQGTLLKLS